MNPKEKHEISEIFISISKVMLCLFLVINAFILFFFGVLDRSDTLPEESTRFLEDWTIDSEESAYTIVTTIPMDIKDNEFLFFDTRKDVAVYINGELRDDFIEKRDVNIPGGSVKSFFMMVPLKGSDSGAEVKIVRLTSLEEEHVIPRAFVGTKAGALSNLMKYHGSSFILAAIVMIFSIVVIIVSFVLGFFYKMKIDMMYGALGIFVLSAWLVTDSYLCPLIFGVNHVSGVLSYLLCNIIPIAPIIYLNSLQPHRALLLPWKT